MSEPENEIVTVEPAGIALIITHKDGSRDVRVPHILVGHRRQHVPVQNAYPRSLEDGHPYFDEGEKRYFIDRKVIPVSELEYLLQWANCLRQDSGESAHDLPTGRAQFEMSDVILRKYTKPYFPDVLPVQDMRTDHEAGRGVVPLGDYREFLEPFRLSAKISPECDASNMPDRTTFIRALDDFVGRYVKKPHTS